MKHARTLIAPLALLVSLSPIVSSPEDGGAADHLPRIAQVAEDREVHDNTYRYEPWHADYPATQTIDGAMVYAQTQAQVEDLVWAMDRYQAAGLELPHVEAWLHDRRSYCDGQVSTGRSGFATWRGGVSIMFGCGSRHTLLHELGHLYDRHMLSDADREAFMALRGLTEWQHETWLQSGQEHLADVLAWALSPGADRHAQTTPRDEASLVAAYELATGLEPLPRVQRSKVGRPS